MNKLQELHKTSILTFDSLFLYFTKKIIFSVNCLPQNDFSLLLKASKETSEKMPAKFVCSEVHKKFKYNL